MLPESMMRGLALPVSVNKQLNMPQEVNLELWLTTEKALFSNPHILAGSEELSSYPIINFVKKLQDSCFFPHQPLASLVQMGRGKCPEKGFI